MAMRRWKKKRRLRPRIPFTIDLILRWADDQHEMTGRWPTRVGGAIHNGPAGENWTRVDNALRLGLRGLPGGSTLAKLLAAARGVRNCMQLPPFTEDQILLWARNHHARTGEWPTQISGPILDAPGETWKVVNHALRDGRRGQPGGSSLVRLLAERVGRRNKAELPRYTITLILQWADAHYRRTGNWPHHDSGPIPEAPGESWDAVESALTRGVRGLPGGSSLAQLLSARRGVRNKARLPHLTYEEILRWSDAHHDCTGRWPTQTSGPIPEAPGETWLAVNHALSQGLRRLPGGSSIAQLLAKKRGVRNRAALPSLTLREIRVWGRAYKERMGRAPTRHSGPITEARGETWAAVDSALRNGLRGLPGGTSLSRMFGRGRPRR